MSDDPRFGLVYQPAYVGWRLSRDKGWIAVCSGDSPGEVAQQMVRFYGKGHTGSLILAAGARPAGADDHHGDDHREDAEAVDDDQDHEDDDDRIPSYHRQPTGAQRRLAHRRHADGQGGTGDR